MTKSSNNATTTPAITATHTQRSIALLPLPAVVNPKYEPIDRADNCGRGERQCADRGATRRGRDHPGPVARTSDDLDPTNGAPKAPYRGNWLCVVRLEPGGL